MTGCFPQLPPSFPPPSDEVGGGSVYESDDFESDSDLSVSTPETNTQQVCSSFCLFCQVCLPNCLHVSASMLPVSLPVHLSVCLLVCVPVCLIVCLLICLAVYLPICLPVCVPVCLSVCWSVCRFIFQSIYLPISLPVCPSLYLLV